MMPKLMKYRAFYDEKILALQNAELEKLKHSGKTVKELRPEMAALIREFESHEAGADLRCAPRNEASEASRPLFREDQGLLGRFPRNPE